MKRYRLTALLILTAFILLTGGFLRSLAQEKPKEIAVDKKPVATPVVVSNDDLIALNGALTMQVDALNRQEKAARETQRAMNDLDSASATIQAISATLPAGAQPIRNAKGAIVRFEIPAKEPPK